MKPFLSFIVELLATDSLSLSLSYNIFISPIFFEDIFPRYAILGWQLCSFSTLKGYDVSFCLSSFLLKCQLPILFLLHWKQCALFSVMVFRFFSLFLFFNIYAVMCLRGCLWIYAICGLLCSLDLWIDIFFFFLEISFTYLLNSYSFSLHLYFCLSFSPSLCLSMSFSLCIHVSFCVFSINLCLISLIQWSPLSNMVSNT